MAIKVRALEMSFINGRRYRAGDEFVLPANLKPGKGLEVIGEVEEVKVKPAKAKKEAKEPASFSELNAGTNPPEGAL